MANIKAKQATRENDFQHGCEDEQAQKAELHNAKKRMMNQAGKKMCTSRMMRCCLVDGVGQGKTKQQRAIKMTSRKEQEHKGIAELMKQRTE